MTASAAGVAAGRFTFLFSEDKRRLIDEFGEHITHRNTKSDKDEYFLNNMHHDLLL